MLRFPTIPGYCKSAEQNVTDPHYSWILQERTAGCYGSLLFLDIVRAQSRMLRIPTIPGYCKSAEQDVTDPHYSWILLERTAGL